MKACALLLTGVMAAAALVGITGTASAAGPMTDQTNLSFTANGVTSKYHLYAAGLDTTKPVGLLVYTDGSGEYGLKNPTSTYLLAGTNGMVAVAKRNNMVLLTPLAPGAGCPDGDGTCWYQTSSGITSTAKAAWSKALVDAVEVDYAVDKNRVALGGYSSGAQWLTEYFGPAHANSVMNDGVAVAISYGGRPIAATNFPPAFKAAVPFVWDVGSNDPAYTGSGQYGVKAGYDWYTANGFTTELNVVPGGTHSRSGQFGPVMDREIQQHVPVAVAPAPTTVPTSAAPPTCA
jgi:poly(3-hydroxybutyrate) depolymerase